MADISQIGSNIRVLREKRGLTQRALADNVLVSFQAISAWERGLSIPDLPPVYGACVEALRTEGLCVGQSFHQKFMDSYKMITC